MVRVSAIPALILGFVALSAVGFTSASAANPTPQSQEKMLRITARAAAENGDFVGAAERLRDASRLAGNRTVAEQADRIADRLQGGSSGADYGELIDLIQEQTSPPALWSDIDDTGGTISVFDQGVFVGGPAVIASAVIRFDAGRLDQVAEAVAEANRNRDVRQTSSLRLVSLTRLQRQVTELLEQGQSLPAEMRHLAGLSRVQYLFVYPDSGDVVIGGPAADWTTDAEGRVVSVENQRPVLQLDDLVVLSRTFGADGPGFFRCSIDPRREQVQAVQQYVKQNRRSLNRRTAVGFADQLEKLLGLQDVIVDGLPADSRVAQVIVNADYRMKQIGIGEVAGAPGMKSYFELLTRAEQRGTAGVDALRWWMAVAHEAVHMSPSRRAFELTGSAVRCLSEDQILQADGTRAATGKAAGANARFAELFTRHFAALAASDAVFADLENVFDLAMVAALVRSQGLSDLAGLDAGSFGPAGEFQAASVEVPQELMTAAEARVYNGRNVVIQVAGGVRGDMSSVVRDASRFVVSPELGEQARLTTPLGQQADHWWWDTSSH